jgi:hypothetical protein
MKIVSIQNNLCLLLFTMLIVACTQQDNKPITVNLIEQKPIEALKTDSIRQIIYYNNQKFTNVFPTQKHSLESIPILRKGRYNVEKWHIGRFYRTKNTIQAKQSDTTDITYEVYTYRFNTKKDLVLLMPSNEEGYEYFGHQDSLYSDTLVIVKGFYRANYHTYYITYQSSQNAFYIIRREFYAHSVRPDYQSVSHQKIKLPDTVNLFNPLYTNFREQGLAVWRATELEDELNIKDDQKWRPKRPYIYRKKEGGRSFYIDNNTKFDERKVNN